MTEQPTAQSIALGKAVLMAIEKKKSSQSNHTSKATRVFSTEFTNEAGVTRHIALLWDDPTAWAISGSRGDAVFSLLSERGLVDVIELD